MLNGTKLYTILFAKDAPATIEINDRKYRINKDEAVLVLADSDDFKVCEGGSLFIIKERSLQLETMYQM